MKIKHRLAFVALVTALLAGCSSNSEDASYNPDKDKAQAGRFKPEGSDNAPKQQEAASQAEAPN